MRADAEHAVLTVDLEAVRANLGIVRGLLAPEVEMAAVVKSDAYGLGLPAVAKALVDSGCRTFFVATMAEALKLRRIHSDIRIVVLQGDPLNIVIEHEAAHLVPVINRDADLDRLVAHDAHFPYVLNIDTGFSRFGATGARISAIAKTGFFLRRSPVLMMSHLACSDQPGDPNNSLQRRRFERVRKLLPQIPASLAASAGVWLGTAFHYDLVRVGSALYGLNNAGVMPNPLRPTVRLHGRILDTRRVSAGEAIGYAATFRTRRESRIAIAGIGYAQGLPWSAANRIQAWCGEIACPVVGRVSMEYCALDVTDVPVAASQPGSWVQFLGEGAGLDDLAGRIGINPQELIVRLGAGCRRDYAGRAERSVEDRAMSYANGNPSSALLSGRSVQVGM